MARVLVLHARLPDGPAPPVLAALLMRLPYAKRLELERRDAAGQAAALAGVWLALEAAARLRGCAVPAGSLRFPGSGRPHLAGGPSFSISHGVTRVAAAVSEDAGIGLDLEEVAMDGGDAVTMLAERRRLERWTATEATLKAAGRGLRDLRLVALDESRAMATLAGEVYRLAAVTMAERVVACLASSARIEAVEVAETILPA